MEATITVEQLNEGEIQETQGEMQAGIQDIQKQLQADTQEILPEDILPSHEILRENLKRRTRPKKLFTDHKCRFCKKVFSDKSGLRHHEQTHNPERPYECSLCSYTAKTRKYLTRHVSLRHKGQPKRMECEHCGKRFMFKCLLEKHQRVHTGEKPNKCDYCGKAFNSRYSLKTHLFIHTNEKPYKCSFCDYACRDTSTLRKHHSTHLGLSKRYPCEQCPKRFDTKARLRTHVELEHLGIQYPKMVCDMCRAEFKTRGSLTTHIKTVHNRAKTCICGVCGKLILNSANLASHMLVHVDMRPFRCTYAGCEKRFKDTSAVKRHAVIHYPDQFMVCQHCGRTFTRRHRLDAHLARFNLEGRCRSNNHRRFYRKAHRPKSAKAKSGPFICDACAYRTNSRRKLVDHLRFGHGTEDDRECKICHKTFRKNEYLQLHYMNNHNLKYTTEINKKVPAKPMVHIKQEPPDFEVSVDMELLDIEKEEPFEEYENKIFQYNLDSWNRHQEESLNSLEKHSLNEEELITNEELFPSERGLNETELISGEESTNNKDNAIEPNISGEVKLNVEQTISYNEEFLTEQNKSEEVESNDTQSIGNSELVSNKKEYNAIEEELINNGEVQLSNEEQRLVGEEQKTKLDENITNDLKEKSTGLHTETTQEVAIENIKDEASDATKRADVSEDDSSKVNSRKAMPVSEFLQHIILAEQSDDDEETESQERLKRRIKELIEKTNLKNGIQTRKNNFGRKLKRVDDAQVPDLMKKYFVSKKNEQTTSESTHARPQKSADATERDRRAKKRRKLKGAGKKAKSKSSKDVSKGDKQEEGKNRSKDARLNTNSMRLIFNMQQCYVCYKVFQTKPDLIEHCKQHFDVCNEITLKKCPFCPYVTHKHIKRHVRLKHKANINFSFMRINDRKDNSKGSRYYFDVDNDQVKEMEIVPSVKILNKRACMELDRRNRELKDKSVLKRKLIKKGNEWVVEHEKLDVSKRLIPKLKGDNDYLERLRLLHLEKKKLGQKIMFPCNGCTKVCQNLSALTLHMRRHDPDAKPFKPKKWKHKTKNVIDKDTDKDGGEVSVKNTDNRTADPKPIVNNHKCDPKLMDFYKENIKGGDVEFWQFLKIYNKMSRDNDFKDLDGLNAFGVEVNESANADNNNGTIDVNNEDGDGKIDDTDVNHDDVNGNSTGEAVNEKTAEVNNKVRVKNKKTKVLQRLGLTVEQYKKRCMIKAKMRREIARKKTI